MKPPADGSVWVPRSDRYVGAGLLAVQVLESTSIDVVTTECREGCGRTTWTIDQLRFHYEPAPPGTSAPVVWPPAAVPVDGALIVRLGDVPVGWLFRDGWEEQGDWNVREDDDGSYDGALVECRPPKGVQ